MNVNLKGRLNWLYNGKRGATSILNLVEKNFINYAHRVAVRDTGGRVMTYREMDEASYRVARALRDQFGVQTNAFVGLYAHRSADIVVAMLGILRSGAAFVPIDPAFPEARVKNILSQINSPMIVSSRDIYRNTGFSESRVLMIDDLPAISAPLDAGASRALVAAGEEDVAYVIFTSGTTGQPKGVVVPNRAVAAFLNGMIENPGMEKHDRLLANASISFDMFIYEIFLPLAVGAEVVIATQDVAGDGDKLVRAIQDFNITTMIATPSTWRLIVSAGWGGDPKFKTVCGGEAFPRDLANILCERSGSVWNIYGPTETAVICMVERVGAGDEAVMLGRPTPGTELIIVDPSGVPVKAGDGGELLIGGPQVTLGYLNDPELTKDKFIMNRIGNAEMAPVLYRSGDVVRQRGDGNYEYHGRIDHQVKVRGFRIELSEIEAVISRWSEIKFNHVTVREDRPGDKRIVAYVITRPESHRLSLSALYGYLREFLPDYMVPHHVMVVLEFPMNVNGKIDGSRLPAPGTKRGELVEAIVPPTSPTERVLAETFADILRFDVIGTRDNLFLLGLNSLLAVQAIDRLRVNGIAVQAAQIYQAQTVAEIANIIDSDGKHVADRFSLTRHRNSSEASASDDNDIAIVGMSGRFPSCESVAEFWDHLISGREGLEKMSLEAVNPSVPAEARRDPQFVPVRGELRAVGNFDAAFFGIAPSEAAMIDPQQRIFLEQCWHALEDAGAVPATFDGRIGVFGGSHRNTYFIETLRRSPDSITKFGDFNAMIASEKDFLATRAAHRLNLSGPAVSVQTGCSTSLVAIIQAVNAIRLGQCEVALAGGVTVSFPRSTGYIYQEDNIQSKDGHCRPFSDEATGTVFTDGAGVVVLRRLSDARAAGDQVVSVIKGVGINNDGRDKASFMAPSITGQLACIQDAIFDAGISPLDISHVEAHGTGTIIGDPIEMKALKNSLTIDDVCASVSIGSIKGNFGHMVAAAGVASVIKVALSMKHRVIPPSINVGRENPECGFDDKFVVNRDLRKWREDVDVFAGVTSLGVGGTNAHVVMKSAPLYPQDRGRCPRPFVLIPVSAKTKTALSSVKAAVAYFISSLRPGWDRVDAAWTLQVGRQEMNVRAYALVSTALDNIEINFIDNSTLGPVVSDSAEGRKAILFDTSIDFNSADYSQALKMTGDSWLTGRKIDWKSHWVDTQPRKISMPLYPFERRRHWVLPDIG